MATGSSREWMHNGQVGKRVKFETTQKCWQYGKKGHDPNGIHCPPTTGRDIRVLACTGVCVCAQRFSRGRSHTHTNALTCFGLRLIFSMCIFTLAMRTHLNPETSTHPAQFLIGPTPIRVCFHPNRLNFRRVIFLSPRCRDRANRSRRETWVSQIRECIHKKSSESNISIVHIPNATWRISCNHLK